MPATSIFSVATVLTVYGIETPEKSIMLICEDNVATVLTVYGIETVANGVICLDGPSDRVATVLTVYGIETYR